MLHVLNLYMFTYIVVKPSVMGSSSDGHLMCGHLNKNGLFVMVSATMTNTLPY